MGYETVRGSSNYWTEEKIIFELKIIINNLKHFPSKEELKNINKSVLHHAIARNGGSIKFRKILGYEPLHKLKNYWTKEKITDELNLIIKQLGHFPSQKEVKDMDRNDLLFAFSKNGGLNRFRELLGYDQLYKPKNYWTKEIVLNELKPIIEELGHFPTINELKSINKTNLIAAIAKYGGGINHLKELLGYELLKKSNGYWTEEIVMIELKPLIDNLGHFPTHMELGDMNKYDLVAGIAKNGGFNYFKQKLGYNLHQKPKNYWNEEIIITELKSIIEELNHFPVMKEIGDLNRYDLYNAIGIHGGINHFRQKLGYEPIQRPNGYWNEEKILIELKLIINKLSHFPTQTELENMNRCDLLSAIANNGGLNCFRKLFGYKLNHKPKNYWTKENIIDELKIIIGDLGHFPTRIELIKIGRYDLQGAIARNGGFNYFRKLLKYTPIQKPKCYWNNEENILIELKSIIEKLGHFPSYTEIIKNTSVLQIAIGKNGGINYFKEKLGYESIKKFNNWTENKILNELKLIIKDLNHFPTKIELEKIKKSGLSSAMTINGGFNHFKELCGYTTSIQDKYKSELMSYIGKRGRNTESIVKQIIEEWLEIHNLPPLSTNVKLAPKNVIEFVCDVGKIVGVDVTNARTKTTITKKWKRKDYHKNLDELWIIVFSNTFTEKDYNKFNIKSPSNVYVMTINDFLQTLDYSTDEYLQNKINKYNECTFHSRPEKPTLTKFFKSQNSITPPDLNNIPPITTP